MLSNDLKKKPDWASPPGDTILSILEEREFTIEKFAVLIGESVATAQRILEGVQAIDQSLAHRLALTLGASEAFWLAREYDYRACVSEPKDARVSSLFDLMDQLPTGDMQKFGWIERTSSKSDKLDECLSFFGVSSLAQWQGRYDGAFQKAAYRQSSKLIACEVATTAWLRQGERETLNDSVDEWSASALEKQIPNIRRLTWYKNPSLFLPKLKKILSECGVKFAIVRAPKGCTASGAVRLLENRVPHLQFSFRYLSDDQFWFSLFHEIGHLLFHFERMPILENGDVDESATESEANEFAARVVVPHQYREELYSLGESRFPIIAFARKVGVAPGLIVGQLQHEGLLGYNQMQHLKRRYQWTA